MIISLVISAFFFLKSGLIDPGSENRLNKEIVYELELFSTKMSQYFGFSIAVEDNGLLIESRKIDLHGNVGKSCSVDKDCKTPMDYLVQSNCPFGSACVNKTCRVVCAIVYNNPNPEINKSYLYPCEENSDCNCDGRKTKTLECVCHNKTCLSIEE